MKSSPIPSTNQVPPSYLNEPFITASATTEPTGSAATISILAFFSLKNSAKPVIVPPEPTPAMTASISVPICSQISGPVLVL